MMAEECSGRALTGVGLKLVLTWFLSADPRLHSVYRLPAPTRLGIESVGVVYSTSVGNRGSWRMDLSPDGIFAITVPCSTSPYAALAYAVAPNDAILAPQK